MKKIVVVLVLFITGSLFAQKGDVYDDFIWRLGTGAKAKIFADEYIDNLAATKKDIPVGVWNSVKSGINYRQFLQDAKEVIKNNYTEQEVTEILNFYAITQNANPGGELVYDQKPQVTEQMYNVGKDFGRQLNYQIKSLLDAKGYE